MPYKLKRWQWALVAVLFPCYVTLAIFMIWGQFYLGVPPYTPAWLNNTTLPIERRFRLDRRTSLRVFGEINEGRLIVWVDDVQVAVIVGKFNKRLILEPGERRVRLENRETIGNLNYSLE
jgi:hypothetical protein